VAKRWTLGQREKITLPPVADGTLTAAAQLVEPSRSLYIQREGWQDQAWAYYHTMGEYRYAIDWTAAANSRVRLRAGLMDPGADEPEVLDSGPVAEIVDGIGGGPGGQAALMSRLTTLLQVPGDSYAFATGTGSLSTWEAYAASIVKIQGNVLRVQTGPSEWATMGPGTLPVRIWNADAERPWLATSPSQSVLGTLGEIDLYNRHIIATLTSRLASNGIIILPKELSFPGQATGAQAPNALVPQLIEVASQAIKNPGSAAAAIPIPFEVPAEFADLVRHLTFSSDVSDQILEAREKALVRLARSLNVPTEILTGMGSVNHWGAWQIEDAAIKVVLSPLCETICNGLTVGYLEPALKAARIPVPEDGRSRYVVWYDLSELQVKPDQAERAIQLHDRVAINDEALRAAGGFDEGSKPTPAQAQQQILTRLAYNGQMITDALTALTGTPVSASTTATPTGERANPPGTDEDADTGPTPSVPDTMDDVPDGAGT
jgi:hypothetical protein